MTPARRLSVLFVSIFAVVLGMLYPNAAYAVSPNIVISQVYGGAGCGTAGCSTYKNDYIELFNRGASAVSVNGWSVQYAAATGTAWQVTNLPNVSIPAGGYLLVAEGAGANGVNNIPTADATGTIAMSATAAKVALVNVTTALSGACPTGATIVDLVGFGATANCNEGGANAPAPSTTTADVRAANGCTDTDSNSSDFTATTPNPRNSATTVAPCGGGSPNLTVNDVSLNEGNAGTTSFTFTVSLSAPAGAGGVTFDIATADGTAQDDTPATEDNDYVAKSLTGQTIPAGSSTYSFTVLVNGDTSPETNETFFVNVTNVTGANVTDGQGQGTIVNDDAAPNLTINDVSLNEGNAGTTTFTFTVSLSAPAGAGGVTFDIATADGTAQDDTPATEDNDYVAKSLTSQTIPAGSSTYTFDVSVNGDIVGEGNETFFVNITNVTNAIAADAQGLGTILNDDLTRIHDVQGNGAATPIPGSTVTVEGIVTGDFQGTSLKGFFLQEEDTDVDADPATSEGIFVFCNTCPTAVAEGQKVQVTGTVSEFNNLTELTASTAPSVLVTNAGNNLALATPAAIDLPVVGVVNDFYEARESMRVNFIDPLIVSEYFELPRYGHIELFEGGRPLQYTETNAPSVAGNTAYLAALDRRRVILDDDNNNENGNLAPFQADGSQFVFHPQANGGFSVGTQGTDFFRGGDQITSLTGILHWSFAGGTSPDTWRIRPTAATPATFTVNNPRPATPPAVGGAIKAAGLNLLNYFTTIDTTSSSSSGPCGPSGTQDCRGADSVAELNRQRARAALVLCTINADVYGLMELENTTATGTINDLLGAVNASCGGAHPYAFVNTGGTLGTDAIRVALIYRTGVLSPVGAALVDLDPVHNRPPTAQTFDVVDAANPAFGKRFTVIANHFKSKSPSGATGGDVDTGDGQSAYSATRTAQANRLLTWINSTVVPAAGDPDVLLLGDFNSYAKETPVTTITSGGYTDVSTALLGPAGAYSYLFDGMLGHLDFAFASASLMPQITGVGPWHINADEADLFDYNDEVKDTGEAAFEEKPDGSALTPPRVVFQPGTPYRAADHDPVTLGLFAVSDLAITKTDSPDPVNAGSNLTYTITVANNGPDVAATASWSDTLPAGTTFVSMPAVAGWSCTTPAVGSGGTISCTNASFAVGSSVFTLTVAVAPSVASGTVLSNTATVTSASGEGNPGNESATATTTVATSANLSVAKVDTPDPVTAGNNLTYTITLNNAGPSNAATVALADTLPAGTTFVSLSSPGGWSCTTPAVGAGGTVNCSIGAFGIGNGVFTLVVNVTPSTAAGTVLSNTATVTTTTSDPASGNESSTATTTVAGSADLSVTKVDTPDPVTAGNQITYTITVDNAGPSNASTVTLTDTFPAGTTMAFLSAPGAWVCPVPPSGGPLVCTHASLPVGTSVFTLKLVVDPSTAAGTVLTNSVTVAATTSDPNSGNNSASATTTVASSADLSVSKVDTPDPVTAGNNLTYTITVNNAGPSNATTVALSDTLPSGTTFVSLSSPGGWSCTTPAVGGTGPVNCSATSLAPGNAVFTLVVNVGAGVATGTVITNTATVTSASDPNPGNESGTATTTVGSGSADLSITKGDSPDPVTAGMNLTYTLTVTNAGPSNATTATLSDTLPANTVFVSLSAPAGWSCTTPALGGTGSVNCTNPLMTTGSAVFTLVVNVNQGAAQGSTITNTATATSATTDPNGGDNSATATTSVNASADLSLTKVDTPDPVSAGSNLTYTITMNNIGPSNAAAPVLSDTVPANTTFVSMTAPAGWNCTTPAVGGTGAISCTVANAAVGNAVFTLVVNVNAATANGTTIVNTASISSNTTDPTPANNSATATSTVNVTSANLSVTKVDNPDPVNAGSNITYTITANNAGPDAASTAVLADTVPAGTTFVSLTSPGGWSCTTPAVGGTGAISCTNPSMAVGNAVFTLVVAVNPATAPNSVISNTATVSSATADPTTGNESATATTSVLSPANVTGTKTINNGAHSPGGPITYTITLSNSGPSAQANNPGDEFTDVLPAQLILVSANASSGTALATVGTNTVTWNGGVPAGGSVTITIQATIRPDIAPGTVITNQGTISYDADGNGTNESTNQTDDPSQAGSGNATGFAVAAPATTGDIPALDPLGLAMLAALLGAVALVMMRRA